METSRPYTLMDAYGREIKKSLTGKTALITGATGLLGSEVAKELARRGVRLMLHYNSHVRRACELELALKMLGTDVTMIQADYTQPSDVKELIHAVNSWTGHLDYLIHTAGVCRISFDPLAISEEDQLHMHQINQLSPIELTFGIEDKMDSKSIILYIGSPIEDAYVEETPVYGDSKKGLHHFASRYANGRTERGITSIYYIPGVLRDSTPHILSGRKGVTEMQALGQTMLLEPAKVARNVIFSLINGSIITGLDEHEGTLLVRRDGYCKQVR